MSCWPALRARLAGAGRSMMRRAFRPRMKCCHLDDRARDGIKLFLLPAAIERAPATENPRTCW
jgi:hypothetical protein